MRRLGQILALLALAPFSMPLQAFAAGAPVVVVVTAKGCEPAELTVPEGEVTFQIVNKSTRALEWEILSGVMVVDERENIAPGFKQRMTTDLKAGEYAVTCGLLSNPQGRLIVTAAAGASGPVRPSATDLIGPTAEWRFFLISEAEGLVRAAGNLAATLSAGDQAKAAEALARAQSHFYHLRPALAPGDSALSGDLAGLASAGSGSPDLAARAERLIAAAKAVQARLTSSALTPGTMASGAAPALGEVAGTDQAPHARKAAIDGVRKIVDLLAPLLARADGALSDRLKTDFAALDRASGGADAEAESAALKTLMADAAKLPPALGLE